MTNPLNPGRFFDNALLMLSQCSDNAQYVTLISEVVAVESSVSGGLFAGVGEVGAELCEQPLLESARVFMQRRGKRTDDAGEAAGVEQRGAQAVVGDLVAVRSGDGPSRCCPG